MSGDNNESTKATIDSLVTLFIDGLGAKRILLTDARCIDALKRRTGRPDSVVATRDPLGRAILNRSASDRFEYRDGACVKDGEILAVDPGPVL